MMCTSENCTCDFLVRVINPLVNLRNTSKHLGSFAGCVFEEPIPFFERFEKEIPITPPQFKFDEKYMLCIGDIHGDFLVLLSVLRLMKIIDDHGNFILAQPTLIVQLGDLLDSSGRGCSLPTNRLKNNREEVDILQYLHWLRLEAEKNGSKIVTLLGNHEISRFDTNLGDFYQKYVGEQWKGWVGEQQGLKEMQQFFHKTMTFYFAKYFPIFVSNRYFVCMHAGISFKTLMYREDILDDVERRALIPNLNENIFKFFTLKIPKENNQLWNYFILPFVLERFPMNPAENSHLDEKDCQKILPTALHIFNTKAFVLGHSIQEDFQPFCNSRVFRIDFGMSYAFACAQEKNLRALFVRQIITNGVFDNNLSKVFLIECGKEEHIYKQQLKPINLNF